MNKVYCRYCGNLIDEDATFCTYCGKEQNVVKSNKSSLDSSKGLDKMHNFSGVVFNRLNVFCRSAATFIKSKNVPVTEEQKALRNKRLKQLGRYFLILFAIALVIAGAVWGYVYYNEEYLPEKRRIEANKRLDEACYDILKKLNSDQDSIKIEYSTKILQNDAYWGFEGVSDNDISNRMMYYQDEALSNLETMAENGNPHVQFLLGNIFYGHKDKAGNLAYAVEPNITKAVYWWNEAAKQKYVSAYNNIGLAYEKGEGVQKDLRKAVEYLKLGAENGESYAQANYGRLFRDGVRIKVGSHKEEYTTMEYQFDNEYKRSYYTSDWRKVYVKERTVDDYKWLVPKDINQAKYWWSKSAEQGNQYAKEMLQKVYE